MNIKLHVDKAEYDPVERTAEVIGCEVEDVVYAALHAFMQRLGHLHAQAGPAGQDQEAEIDALCREVMDLKRSRRHIRAPWADNPGLVDNIEPFPVEPPPQSRTAL